MTELNKKAFRGFAFLFAAMAALLFLPAWSLRFWQSWLFLAVFFGCALAITLYLMKNDTALLERRMRGGPWAEKEESQKRIQLLTSVGFAAMLVVPALDHRFAWTPVPAYVSLTGDALVALGFLVMFSVFRQNSFAAGTVEVAPDQRVVSTGLYAFVRHPMYLGGLFLFIGMPVALGSWSGLLVFAVMLPALLWRLLDEEKFLARTLSGYSEYQSQVRFRLVPFVW